MSQAIRWVTGWLCLRCGHWSPPGPAPQNCCDDQFAMRAGLRNPVRGQG
jgi:hypothetical protein